MKKSNFYRLCVCLGIAALSVTCVACSIKAGSSDPDRTSAAGTSAVETEMTEETTAETKKKAKETKPTEKEPGETTVEESTERTKSSTEESTAETAVTPGIYKGPEITPPAERVYPITSEDAIAAFESVGLCHMNMDPDLEYVEEEIDAFDPSFTYRFVYCAFTEEEVADLYLETLQQGLMTDENGRPFEGTCEVTEEDGYSILVARGEYKNGDPLYVVAISVDNVIISGLILSTEDYDTKVVDYCFIGLGYM